MPEPPETELEIAARELIAAFRATRNITTFVNNLESALRDQRSAFQVCPYEHDHPRGDPSYDDCVAAFEDAKARMADVAGIAGLTPATPDDIESRLTLAGLDARLTLLEGLYQGHDEIISTIAERLHANVSATAFPPDPVSYFKQHAGELAEGISDSAPPEAVEVRTAGRRAGKTAEAAEHLAKSLLVGHRYRLVYRSDTQRIDHESVLDYLNQNDTDFILSARPMAGTQHLPMRWVKSITEVPRDTKMVIDRPVRQA